MANFTPSNLVAGQALFNEKFLSGEWKLPDIAAIKTAQMGEIANPSLAGLRTREDRTVTAYFPIRQAAVNGTGRVHNHTGARGDSLSQSITWSTLQETFSISAKQLDNNVMSYEMAYAAALKNAIFNLLNRADAAFVTNLLADKTQYAEDGGNGTFDETTDDYQLDGTYKDYFFQEVKAYLAQNLYTSNLIGIVDSRGYVLAEKNRAQGSGNSNNLAFQFMGYENILPTTRTLLSTSTYQASGLFFEPGLVANIPWIPKQNRKPLNPQAVMEYNGDMGSISVPELGVDFAVHAYSVRADASSANGSAQDLVTYFEVSIDFGYVSAPLSTFRGANDSVVYSAGILS